MINFLLFLDLWQIADLLMHLIIFVSHLSLNIVNSAFNSALKNLFFLCTFLKYDRKLSLLAQTDREITDQESRLAV